MNEKKYLVDSSGTELAACGECPIGRFDEDGGCISEWRMCHQWRTEWLAAHEYKERTCRMVDNGVELCCSECDRRHDYDDEPQFCMGCGAKVVS